MAQSTFFWLSRPVLVFAVAFSAQLALWTYSSREHPNWANVPEPPSSVAVAAAFLGDREVGYRTSVLALQAFGNETGRDHALKDYNYDNVGKWLMMTDQLNSESEYAPWLAGYYFGSTQNPEQLYPVIEYLRKVGKYPEKDKWRWLGQAVFLAKHKLKNDKLALELADELAETYRPGMPAWPLQMKAIVASEMGEKDMAYGMIVEMLKNDTVGMDPTEVNFMVDYLCNTILSPVQKKQDELCKGL